MVSLTVKSDNSKSSYAPMSQFLAMKWDKPLDRMAAHKAFLQATNIFRLRGSRTK